MMHRIYRDQGYCLRIIINIFTIVWGEGGQKVMIGMIKSEMLTIVDGPLHVIHVAQVTW